LADRFAAGKKLYRRPGTGSYRVAQGHVVFQSHMSNL
jgi:hypothetical protein